MDIFSNPDLVVTDGVVAWKTALWFWMNSWKPPHNVLYTGGFGQTTNVINGALECGKSQGTEQYKQMAMRAQFYTQISADLGVSLLPGSSYC